MPDDAPLKPESFGDRAWDALVSNPAVAASVVTREGIIKFANNKAARMFLDAEPAEVIGKHMADLFPKAWVDERLRLFQQIMDTGKPIILRSIRRGRQIQSTVQMLDCQTEPSFLVITHEGQHEVNHPDTDYQIIEANTADFGPLDVLTRRELEVLSLIKHGMTLDEIAKVLHRSRKTIDNHRQSIANKLGESSRVRLAQIAHEAGLEISDATLTRTQTRRN